MSRLLKVAHTIGKTTSGKLDRVAVQRLLTSMPSGNKRELSDIVSELEELGYGRDRNLYLALTLYCSRIFEPKSPKDEEILFETYSMFLHPKEKSSKALWIGPHKSTLRELRINLGTTILYIRDLWESVSSRSK